MGRRLPALAADLVRRQVEVLVTGGGTNVTRVAQAATTTIPIIFANASDPVQDGIVKSINRPGGNTTGTYVLWQTPMPSRRYHSAHIHARHAGHHVMSVLVREQRKTWSFPTRSCRAPRPVTM